ncbi:hypothetical protein ACSMXM_01365 [Pacificimonas sp. ICDLI1SI03]
MSLRACIPGLVADGALTRERAAELTGDLDRLEAEYARTYGEAAAPHMASKAVTEAMARRFARERKQKLLTVQAQAQAMANVKRYKASDRMRAKGDVMGRAFQTMIETDDRAPYGSVAYRIRSLSSMAHGRMTELYQKHSRNLFGKIRDEEGMKDVLRAAKGEATGNAAANAMAKTWGEVTDELRRLYNAAGGDIGELRDWGMPHVHNAGEIRRTGFEAWRADILPRLDRERMIDGETGLRFSEERLEFALRDVFDTITTAGANKMVPGAAGAGGGGKLANGRTAERFLHFRSSDDWLAYHERFGDGTIFDTMVSHIDGMARDIAHMQILGPNPDHTIRWMQDHIQKEAKIAGRDGKGQAAVLGRMYDVTSGRAAVPENEKVARYMQGVRSWLTASYLGSAVISAVGDLGFGALTRSYTGAKGGAVSSLLTQATSDLTRKQAMRMGYGVEEATRTAASHARFTGEHLDLGWTSDLASGVLRASGLTAWTEGGKRAFALDLLGALSDQSDRAFADLEAPLRRTLERAGIGADGWDVVRAAEQMEGLYVWPEKVGGELGQRLNEMVIYEGDFAVPTTTVRGQAMLSGPAPGTLIGELLRSGAMFKSFGVSLVMLHGRRMVGQQEWNPWVYGAYMIGTTTLLGALAVQAKEVVKGRDPRPMFTPEFLGASLFQGGGLGIFGDFLTSAENRFGGGFAQTVAGPGVQLAGDVASMPAGLVMDLAEAEDVRLGRDLAKFARRNVPGSSLWYARAAYERVVVDSFQQLVDPDAAQSFRAMERQAKDFETQYWWRPGETAPDRAPDLAAASG